MVFADLENLIFKIIRSFEVKADSFFNFFDNLEKEEENKDNAEGDGEDEVGYLIREKWGKLDFDEF